MEQIRITIPLKIKQNLASIAEVLLEHDDLNQPALGILKFPVAKEHFEKAYFVSIHEIIWQSCSFLRYRIKYLNTIEEVIEFKSKDKALYEEKIERASLEINFFEDSPPHTQKKWVFARGELVWAYSPETVLNTSFLDGEDLARFSATVNFPETGVLSLENGLISEKGLVYDDSGKTRFLELSRFSSIEELSKHKKEMTIFQNMRLGSSCKLDNIKYVRGRALNLHTLFGNFNFCHGFLDVASLLNTAHLVGIDFQNYDYYVVPENSFSLTKDLFKRLKLDRKKFLYAGQLKIDAKIEPREYSLMFDRLDTPSFDGMCDYYAPGAFNFLRHIYNVGDQHKKRRIYLSREDKNRGVVNEQDLLELLEYYGFEILYGGHQLDIPRIMSEASVVLGAHGAAMANCVFCTKQSTLIDLMPKNYAYPYYVSLANSVGFKYHLVISKIIKGAEEKKWQIVADIPKIKKLLDEVCHG